jgi:hypothetical protein
LIFQEQYVYDGAVMVSIGQRVSAWTTQDRDL